MITKELIDNVEDTLRDKHVCADVYSDIDDFKREVLKIEITWGDWKHDHLLAKWVVEDVLGIKVLKWEETVMEENGSDCYSAVHTLWLADV